MNINPLDKGIKADMWIFGALSG